MIDANRNMMHGLAAACLILALSAASAQDLPRIHETRTVSLPLALDALLTSEYADYHLPTERDFLYWKTPQNEAYYESLKEEVERFRKAAFLDPNQPGLPFVCWGDYNGDELIDIALILLRSTRSAADSGAERPEQLLIAFHQTESGYRPVELFAGDKQLHFGHYIQTMEPGRILTIKGKGYELPADDPMPESVELDHESILFGITGKAASLIFWENERYHEVPISD